ncbi:hypothetical protein L6452_19367 [Arctium lappa]|uniref:Uncharacterized protein n=1 Tax=Arctium lappa TaxID=4217 RepID=A0ACB9B986_ARCLA|nr:hypothetical protein L6452_19367 [Arctium lappa]
MVWRVKDSSDEKKNDKASASPSIAKMNNAHKGIEPMPTLAITPPATRFFLNKEVFHFLGDATYLLSGLHSEDLDIEKEGKLPHLRTSFMHIEFV